MNPIKTINKAYAQYINERSGISTPDMAASLELCQYIFNLCEQYQYKKVIDLGSGITSFALRYYQSLHDNVIVYSVDDNHDWLQRTKDFVISHGLNSENFICGIDNILESDFDLVVYDYGRMPTRTKNLESAINLCKSDGIIYCDDCQKTKYYEHVKQTASKTFNITAIDETIDQFNRFGVILTKN